METGRVGTPHLTNWFHTVHASDVRYIPISHNHYDEAAKKTEREKDIRPAGFEPAT